MELVYLIASGAVRLAILAFLPRLSKNSQSRPTTLCEQPRADHDDRDIHLVHIWP